MPDIPTSLFLVNSFQPMTDIVVPYVVTWRWYDCSFARWCIGTATSSSFWWSASLICCWSFICIHQCLSQFVCKLTKCKHLAVWCSKLRIVIPIHLPCVYFASIYQMPKHFYVPSFSFDIDSIQCNQHIGQINTTDALGVQRNDWWTLNRNWRLSCLVWTFNCWHWLHTNIIWTKLHNFIINPFCNDQTCNHFCNPTHLDLPFQDPF